MKRLALFYIGLCLVVAACNGLAQTRDAGLETVTPDETERSTEKADLATITPEEAGWSAEKLDELAEYVDSVGYTALVVAQGDKVVFSWGEVTKNYQAHSIRKPLLSALYGFYVADGTIDLDLTMDKLGIDDIPPSLTPEEKQATIRHLLQGRSGVYHPAAAEVASMIAKRPERGSHAPGTFFYYNNWDFNAAGTIFRQLTGKDIFEEFERRIAKPIGMQDFDTDLCHYNLEEKRSQHPSYRFRISARDLARFGILYLHDGVWEGKQLIPADWIEESTRTYSKDIEGVGAGFGYMWGTILEGGVLYKMLGGTGLFFSGIGVHHLVIVDDLDLVFVLRFDTDSNWTPPSPESTRKLYGLLLAARPE
ncbi:MAG: serine hydrolase [Acidobacteriota bacterium]|nr:MAG: serine hydrolase [Acidobacteriota bacterium]